MALSVAIPSFNERDHLTACLDALGSLGGDIETIVVNGPSTDGTSGVLQNREDVDVLLECASRNLNIARNAGIREASKAIVAVLSPAYRVQSSWLRTIEENLAGAADAATGPVQPVESSDAAEDVRPADDGQLAIRGGNVALTKSALTALDGYDEYLPAGGTADLAQRLSGLGLQIIWHPEMRVQQIATPDGGRLGVHRSHRGMGWQTRDDPDWGVLYRSLTYRHVKNDGPAPAVLFRIIHSALRDGGSAAREVLHGRGTPSEWIGNGTAVVSNTVIGARDGIRARQADRTPTRNPHGLSRPEAAQAIAETRDWR